MTLSAALADHRAGRLDAAEPVYRRLLAERPDDADLLHLLAVLTLQRGRPAEALPLAERSVAADASLPRPWNTLGNIRAALGDAAAAVAAFERAVALDDTMVEARQNLAILLDRLGRLTEAETHLRLLVERQPADAAARNNLGGVLHRLGRRDEAVAEFREAVRLAPEMPQARLNLGIRAREAGDVAEAHRCLDGLPGAGARLLRETALPAILVSGEEIDRVRLGYEQGLDRLLADPPVIADPLTELGQLPQFFLAYHDRDDRPLQEKLARMLRCACPGLSFTAPHCRPGGWNPGKRLRVGVISTHLHSHTIGKLQVGMLAGLPRDRLEVLVFTPPGADDAVARRIRGGADAAVTLPGDLAAVQRVLAEARLDVAFYPDIGMEPFTYFLAFARVAPVQATTWGHPVTTGLDSMDWFVTSEVMDPPGNEAHYSERLFRFDHPGVCYDRPAKPAKGREALGLPEAGRLYVCPQTMFKLHPDFDRLLAAILRRDPGGRVVFIENRPDWRRVLQARFATSMPDVAERVMFVPPLVVEDYLGLCAAADVMLDVPQFAGGNTTLEGLAMGTPIVTLPSRFARGRLAAALLGRAGLDWGVAADEADYVDKALAIAADPAPWRRKVEADAPALYQDRARVKEFADFLAFAVEERRS
jgi:predicted O-linked N-acetylglucosamine transferase (SPINDLY family)